MMLVHSMVKKLQNQEFDPKFKMQRKIGFYVFIILGIIGLYFYFSFSFSFCLFMYLDKVFRKNKGV